MKPHRYTVNMEAQPRRGKRHVASWVLGVLDASVIERKIIPPCLSTCSDVLAHAYDAGRARASALRAEAMQPESGSDAVEPFRYAPCTSAARAAAS